MAPKDMFLCNFSVLFRDTVRDQNLGFKVYNTTIMVIITGESQNHWNIQDTILFNRFSRHSTKSTYPVCTSHILIVLSLEADTIWSPLGMMATEETLWSWPKTHNMAKYWVIYQEKLNFTLPLDFTMGFQVIQQL